MSYRNKTYVCFDADNDIHYYRLMQAWKANENIDFNFHNAHDLNTIRSGSSEDTIKRRLRERMDDTKLFVVLIGEKTKNLHQFVRWEQDVALKMELPIIAVNLNGKRFIDYDRCPPIIRDELAIHIAYGPKIMKYALDAWQYWHYEHKKNGISGPRYYADEIYARL